MNNSIKVGIIGAGIQGISNALFLQKKGFKVTIFDRENPGSPAASYGNAGHFSPYASLSLNRTDVLADVPAMLLSSTGPLALKWNYVPKMIPWFLRFILNTSEKKMMHTAKNMHQILDLALPAYDELFDEIDLENLVENKGILYVWNDKDLKSRELEIKVRNELGVKQQLVNKNEIHDLEPNLKPFYHAGVYYPYARHARNPKKILLKLFELFLKKGGKFNKVNIQEIEFDNEKPVFIADNQKYIFDKSVIDKLKNVIGILSERDLSRFIYVEKFNLNFPVAFEKARDNHDLFFVRKSFIFVARRFEGRPVQCEADSTSRKPHRVRVEG